VLRLPISGALARWRPATGHDDVLLAEAGTGLAGVVAWVTRCVEDGDGRALDAAALPVGDLDLLVLARRRELRSDRFIAEGSCVHCDTPVDVTFSLTAYAGHCRPGRPRGVEPAEQGWWRLRAQGVTFRVPATADVLAAADTVRPRRLLIERCVRGQPNPRQAAAAERAMARLAPTLRSQVTGGCPECGREVLLDVDARELCLAELRFLAGSVHDDVHLIASAYGWSEPAILDLPSSRRRRYADLIVGSVTPAEVSLG
jgi:hypothetical protein